MPQLDKEIIKKYNSCMLGLRILNGSRCIRRYIQRRQSCTDVTILINAVCLHVYANPGCTQEFIAERLKIDTSSAGKIISKAIKSNLLSRKKSTEDRHKYELSITEEGKAIAEETLNSIYSWQEEVMHSLSMEERRYLFYLFAKLSCPNPTHQDLL